MLRLALLLLLLLSPGAGDDPKGPLDGSFLVRGVTVWQPQGEPLADRSLLLRDGLIAAIGGADLQAPPAARVIEAGAGWTAYPGFVHADWNEGLGELEDSPYPDEATDPKTDPVPEMERGDRKDLRGWLHAADVVDWSPGKAKDWRLNGFTSAYLVPKEGLVRGRAAWVSFNDRPLGQALLEREGLMTLSLRSRGSGYPGTPMASLAVLRQTLSDARRLERLERAGQLRRRDDPDLRGLLADRERPWLAVANSVREIENLLDLMDESAPGRRLVILGGREADELAGRLAQSGAAVLYRLDLEDAPKTDEKLKVKPPEERPYWQEPARQREADRAEHARTVGRFLRLREAGVPCALVPAKNVKDLLEDLEQLAEAGLSADELLRALSTDPARILGLPGAGRLAAGSAADFFVTRGEWNADEPDLAWVFADGRGYELPEKEKKKDKKDEAEEDGEEGGESSPAALLDGEWEFSVETPGGSQTFTVTVDTASSRAVLASPDEPGEENEVEIEFEDNRFSFSFSPPGTDFTLTMKVEVYGDDAEAQLILPEGMGTMEAEGYRKKKPESDLRSGRLQEPEEEQEPDAELDAEPEEEKEEEEPEADAEPGGLPAGHPEYLVETRADRVPERMLSGNVLLRGAILYPMTGRSPFQGDLLIQDGKIAGIGEEIHTLLAVEEIDATGWHVMPGIIDAHSHLALDSVNEGTLAITAECRIADMIHPGSVGIYRAAAGGCAVNQSLHGSANPIGGQAAVWELDVNRATIAELLVPGAPQGIKFALGENVKQSNFGNSGNRFPTSRPGVEAVYRRAFTRAREYAEARRQADAGRNPAFRHDERLEVLAGILENRIHIQCHSYRADEILMFLGICREFGIRRPTFQHVLEGYKVAPEMAAAGAMGSTFSDWWAYKIEAYDAIPWNAALMQRAGVTASINSDSGEMIRRLNTEAGKSLLYGKLSYDQAMALCTLNSAIQLRLDDRLGSLEVGKDGTISVFDAPPLSTYARCVMTLARGRVLFERAAGYDARWRDYGAAAAAFAAAHRAPAEEEQPEPVRRSPGDWDRWTGAGQGLSDFIRNARVHPVSAEAFDGSVLVQDGRIAWTGKAWDGPLPQGCESIDAKGLHLYPGFINAGDRIGLYEIGSVRGTVDSSETGNFQPDLSMATAIHGESTHFAVHRMTGITTALVHGTRGRVTGQAALVHLDGELTPDFVVEPDLALHLRFPRVSPPKEGKDPEDPDALEKLDRDFDDAIEYGERLERCRLAGTRLPERNLKYEALLPYARGEKPVLVEARDHLTLMRALVWVRTRELDAIYVDAREGWKGAGLLGMENAKVITGPVHSVPRGGSSPYDSDFRNAGLLAAAGCKVALRTADPEVTRNLPFQAATAAAHGWNRDGALRAMTLGAAEVLGVDDLTGSIEAGKVADLFLCSGDPLDFKGEVVRLWIGGREVELESKQTRLRDKYEARIDRMRAPTR